VAALLASWALAQPPDAAERFDRVWRLVDERYWNLDEHPVDWSAVRERFEPRVGGLEDEEALHALLSEMVALLDDDHSRYVPPDEVDRVREAYGDLPCIGVFAHAGDGAIGRSGPVRWRLEDGLGIVRVEDLARAGTADGVRRAALDLERRGARALALDLRGNPGGRLVEMMATAGVFTRGLLWRVATTWTFPLPYPAIGVPASELPLAVLVDGAVASAAEGLAGALQASGRATVVGERTAGNVEAVLPFCLRDGAQVWLATGVLAPLRGPTWEGAGVVPDVGVPAGKAVAAAREALLGGP
jgi:carboxyl-terminal processing protease